MKDSVCGAAPAGFVAVNMTPPLVAVAAADKTIVFGGVMVPMVVPAGMPAPVTVAPTSKPVVVGTVTVVEPNVVEEPASVIGALCGVKAVEDTAFTGDVRTPLVLKVIGCGLVAIGTLMPSTVRYWFHAFVAVLTKYSDATWLPPRLS